MEKLDKFRMALRDIETCTWNISNTKEYEKVKEIKNTIANKQRKLCNLYYSMSGYEIDIFVDETDTLQQQAQALTNLTFGRKNIFAEFISSLKTQFYVINGVVGGFAYSNFDFVLENVMKMIELDQQIKEIKAEMDLEEEMIVEPATEPDELAANGTRQDNIDLLQDKYEQLYTELVELGSKTNV